VNNDFDTRSAVLEADKKPCFAHTLSLSRCGGRAVHISIHTLHPPSGRVESEGRAFGEARYDNGVRPHLGLFVRFLVLGASLVMASAFANAAEAAERPPNIVFLLSDDQAWTDYGFMGHPHIQTPNLDKLAKQSAVFTRGYVPTALCRPSLATFATGLYAHQHKISGNDPSHDLADPKSPQYRELQARLIGHIDEHPTLPKLLAAQGYLSHQSGKWWEGNYRRGGFTHGMTRGFPQAGGRHGDDGLKIGRQGMDPVFDFIDHAIDQNKPFYIWYAPFMPHTPHTPPERLLAKYRDKVDSIFVARYFAMCEWFDETCGELIDHIEDKGLTDNTLFVYICDNGWIQNPDGEGYAPRSKQSPNEGGTRQPIMLSWRGVIAPQQRDELASSIDLAPTILSAAGASVPENLPGLDLLPLVRDGEPLGRDTIFGEGFAHDIADIDHPEASLLYRWAIEGRWKLLLTYDGKLGRYASSHPRSERRPQLYDLLEDPHEQRNLAADNPDIVDRLATKIAAWWPVKERETITEWTP
jgi:arylsulfatase A-like enzyme